MGDCMTKEVVKANVRSYRGESRSLLDIDLASIARDPFNELISQIDKLVGAIPNIVIPSTVIGRGRVSAFKDIIKNVTKNMDNVGRFGMTACSVVNLLAQHSGNRKISRMSGFIQNCLAIYSIGDAINNKLKLRWNFCDALYAVSVGIIPQANLFDWDYIRSMTDTFHGKNTMSGNSIPLSSAFALVQMFDKNEAFDWFSAQDQETHHIVPLFTNIERAERIAMYDEDGDSKYDSTSLRYIVKREMGCTCKTGGGDRAVFVFKFDSTTVYLHLGLSKILTTKNNDDDDDSDTDQDDDASGIIERSPSYSNIQVMCVPDKMDTEYAAGKVNRNLTTFLNMIFAMFLDTENYVFSLNDDSELVETPRPRSVPSKFVSDKIPTIINAIEVMHQKVISRGFAFVGHPGTGKTIAAQQIADHFKDVCTFKLNASDVDDSDIVDSFINYVKAVKKCIIILDDMDSSNLSTKNTSVCNFLTFFDKLNLAAKNDKVSYVFIATINDPSRVNSTIMRRSGRIDEMIEIGYPSAEVIRYLFNYNDEQVNPNDRTDFNDSKFDEAMECAAASHVTAADISNIFADIVIYNGHKEGGIDPQMVMDGIARVNTRNEMSTKNYLINDSMNRGMMPGDGMLRDERCDY